MHLLSEVKDFKLNKIEVLVIDEADRMFELGFMTQINEILNKLPKERQTLLFSATMPQKVAEFSRAGLKKNVKIIRLDTDMKISDKLRLSFFFIRNIENKIAALVYILTELFSHKKQNTIIFVPTRHHVDLIGEILNKLIPYLKYSLVYGSMDMKARENNLNDFRKKKTTVLIVTDVAARGIDIPLLNNVINFSFPASSKLFIHRIGRAARQVNNI